MRREILLIAVLVLGSPSLPAALAQNGLPAPAPPSKTLPVASAPAAPSLPSLDPPKPAPLAAPAPCIARPLTGPRPRAGAQTSKLWPNGSTLRVYFSGGDERVIAQLLPLWERGWGADANLKLVRSYDINQSDVRFGFQRGGGNYSLLGTDARLYPGQLTGNLDIGPETPPEEIRRLWLHEGGHGLLAFDHNMSLPDATHRLIKEMMVAYYQQTQGWSYQQAAAQVAEVSATLLHPKSTVDWDSIMQYYVPPYADRLGIGVGWITDLSPGDRKSARDFYPGRTPATSPPGTIPPPPGTPPPTSSPPTYHVTHRAGTTWTGSLDLAEPKQVTVWIKVIDRRPAPDPLVEVSAVGSTVPPLKLFMEGGTDGVFVGRFRGGPGKYVVVVGFLSTATFDFEVQAAR